MTDDATETRASPPSPDGPAATGAKHPPRHRRSWERRGLPRLVKSLLRLADLQYQIWLTRAKLTALKIALFLGLFAAAAALALLSIIFIYLGTFRLLTDQLQIPTSYAFLLFAALHLLIAAVLAFAGYRILTRRDELPPDQPPAAKGGPPS